METETLLITPQQTWQALLNAPADTVYDQLADLLKLPRIAEFPRPGNARGWTATDWLNWGTDRGFVLGPKTKHGQIIQHKIWPSVCMAPAGSSGDMRSSMNCAQDGRRALAHFLEKARQCCRVLAQENIEPDYQRSLGDWLITQLTGTAGQALGERAKKALSSETPEQALEADALLKRLKPFYSSSRQVLIDAGLTENTVDKLVLLNKGKSTWTFMGLADQLIPVLKLLLEDHAAPEQQEVDSVETLPPEPEVLGPEIITREQDLDLTVAENLSFDGKLTVAHADMSLKKLEAMVATQSRVIDRAAQEIPEFVRAVRQRNTTFYRMLTDFIEFQTRQHSLITKAEQSDLFTKLAEAQQELRSLRKIGSDIVSMMIATDQDIVIVRKKLDEARVTITKQAGIITKLEEQATDPQVVHAEQKLKDIRALFDGKLDVFELVKNVERAKQMLDALIKANKG